MALEPSGACTASRTLTDIGAWSVLRGVVDLGRAPAACPCAASTCSRRGRSGTSAAVRSADLPFCVRGTARGPRRVMPGRAGDAGVQRLELVLVGRQLRRSASRSRRSAAASCRPGSACRSAPCRRPRSPGDVPRTTSRWPAAQTRRAAGGEHGAAPPAATLAATPPPPVAPPSRCRMPASGPSPTGGTSARSRAARGLQPVAELAAGGAAAQVAERVLGRAPALVVGGQQDLADRGAVGVARLGGGDEAGARALDELARGGRARSRARSRPRRG